MTDPEFTPFGIPPVSTPADGAQGAPAVAAPVHVENGLHAWLEAQEAKVTQAIHELAAHVEAPVKSAESAISAGIEGTGKVEGDVVQDLKALVHHLHEKYDVVVERVRKLETHLGFA